MAAGCLRRFPRPTPGRPAQARPGADLLPCGVPRHVSGRRSPCDAPSGRPRSPRDHLQPLRHARRLGDREPYRALRPDRLLPVPDPRHRAWRASSAKARWRTRPRTSSSRPGRRRSAGRSPRSALRAHRPAQRHLHRRPPPRALFRLERGREPARRAQSRLRPARDAALVVHAARIDRLRDHRRRGDAELRAPRRRSGR